MKIGQPPVKKPALPPAATAGGHAVATEATAGTKPTPAATPVSSSSTAIPRTADASAKIAISSSAETLLSGSGHADFDTAKVARITRAIEDGSFKVNPEAIADKLIANAKEVLTKR